MKNPSEDDRIDLVGTAELFQNKTKTDTNHTLTNLLKQAPDLSLFI